ncbi:unnamed protein product [Symbiodinium sp. KB8]|nr:unnamed protein product [Symbiodinium sp. KB8]
MVKHPSTPSTTSVKSAVGVLAESPTTWSFNFQQELFVCNRIGARGLESTDMGYGSSPGESLAPPPALFAKNWTGVRRFTCVVEEIAPNLVLPIAKPMRLSTLRLWLTSGPTENSVDGGVLSPPLWPRVAEKAGNCLDPEEERAKEQLEVWLAAWKINPERPRNQLLLVPSHGREPLSTEPTTWPDAAAFFQECGLGYPDPLVGRVRLWAALAGMQRWDGAPIRQVPVTPAMLGWIHSYLQGSDLEFFKTEEGALGKKLIPWPSNYGIRKGISLEEVKCGFSIKPGSTSARFEHCNGIGVTREQISELLRVAAVALGYPAHLVASHSLRKGGATAMLSVTDDVEVVKRFGGGKSDAIHAYWYTDLASAPERGQRHARIPPSTLVVEDRSPTSGGDEFGSSDEDTDWRSARAKLENLERRAWAASTSKPQWTSVEAWQFMELPRGAPLGEIVKAFKKLAIRLHPDKSPEDTREEATVKFQALSNAKETLLTHAPGNMLNQGPTSVPPPPSAPPSASRGVVPKYGTAKGTLGLAADRGHKGEAPDQVGPGTSVRTRRSTAEESDFPYAPTGRTTSGDESLFRDLPFGLHVFYKSTGMPKKAPPPELRPANRLNRYACNGCGAGLYSPESVLELFWLEDAGCRADPQRAADGDHHGPSQRRMLRTLLDQFQRMGAPPLAAEDLNDQDRAEIKRIENECADLEKQLRDLTG